MESEMDREAALAALTWQIELGADEAIAERPVDRYALDAAPAAPAPGPAPAVPASETDWPAAARRAAEAASDLEGLRAAIAAFEGCDLKRGARNLVFCDGSAGARVMLVGEAPGREEDREGKPFVGRAGRLLDRMFGAIGLSRQAGGIYLTNVLPWRPPQNRDPTAEEIAMLTPFVTRHIALADPEILLVVGNISAQTLLGRRGITKIRGTWTEAQGRPTLPILHPAYLLRNPAAKRESWADMLSLKARLT